MRSAGKARDCLRFSLLLGEQVAQDCFSTQNKAMGELFSVLIESTLFSTVTNSHVRSKHDTNTFQFVNPRHLRSMEGRCVHKETKFITKSTFSSKQFSFSSKLKKYSRHPSLSSLSCVLSPLISSSCFSKALCKFCTY